jgi:hypothetical protein
MKDTIQFILIVALFGYIIFLEQCKGSRNQTEPIQIRTDTTIVIDTTFPTPIIVQMPRQIVPEPRILYVDRDRNIIPTAQVDTNQHQAAQLYQDSLEDENLTIYYKSMVQGLLLDYSLDYKLKIPTQITKTIEIRKPIPVPAHCLMFNTGVGVDHQGLSSVTVGIQFVSRKSWAVGYDYDVLQNQHRMKLGIKLWNQKKFK